jgi:hypothetical protein
MRIGQPSPPVNFKDWESKTSTKSHEAESEQEGEILPSWCDTYGYHSVVFINY